MKLKPLERRDILLVYDQIEEREPDISTERLLSTVAERCRVDVADVCDVLQMYRSHQPGRASG